jgi:hypothetical protein
MGELYEVRYGVVLHVRYEPKDRVGLATMEQQIERWRGIVEFDQKQLAHIHARLESDKDPKVLEVLRGELAKREYFTRLDEEHLAMLERKRSI